jgi:hypothetical protein
MSKYLKTKDGSIESAVLKSVNTPKEEPKKVNVEFKSSSYFGVKEGTVSDAASKAINEKVDNAYAIGMSQAMKKTGDNPPLKKSTITKAHDIAKSIKKDEVKESDAYDNNRYMMKKYGGQILARPDNSNTKDGKDHVYAPNAQIAKQLYSQGKKVYKEETINEAEYKAEENEYKALFKKELEKSGKSLSSMSDSEKKDFFNKIDTMYKGKNEELSAAQKKLPPALQKAIAKKMASKKEDVKETHTYHKDKQNKKQTKADGEKEIVDPNPKLKAEDVIRGLWEKAVDDQKEADEKDKEDSSKQALKVKLAKEKDTDALEKQLVALQGQNNVLKQKLENEKNKAIKPEPNPDTGEVPLTVGIAYKHLRDKMKKEEKISEARWEIEGRVSYKNVGPEDSFHMVIDAPSKDAAERKAYNELDKARQRRKIGPGGGGSIEDADIESIERTNDRLSPPEAGFMGNSYDPTQKEEVSQKDVDKFHTSLDKLVHKSFGHSSDEKKKEKKTKGKADTGSPKTPVDTEPQVDYKN